MHKWLSSHDSDFTLIPFNITLKTIAIGVDSLITVLHNTQSFVERLLTLEARLHI
jgi:hypothetical protein